MKSLPAQRHLFDIPEGIAYFNCAYNSPLLKSSRDRLQAGVDTKCHPWERTAESFFDDAETIRVLCADILGGDSDGYAVVPAASYGISTAARAIEPTLGTGDQILIMAEEFPSNVLPWQRTARETGAEVVTVPTPPDGDWTRAIATRITKDVKVVAVSPCHWTNGAYIGLDKISAVCRDRDAALVLDATQTFAAVPFAFETIQPDFLVAAGYKWLLCPYGVSLLYVAPRWRDARPLEESWLTRDNAQNFAALVAYSENYLPGARRFEVGEKCSATLLPGAIAALEQIKAWGVSNIAYTLQTINTKIAAHLESLGFQLPQSAQRSPHMFGAVLPQTFAGNLVAELAARSIYISQRGDALRFAPHLHVTEDDLNRLFETLADLGYGVG